jgi:chromate reductase
MAPETVQVVGLCGSLRAGSFNASLLRIVARRMPAGSSLTVADIGALPLYNQDLEHDGRFPAPVEEVRATVGAADAMLFCTPEYNFSVTGVLKNALDWLSRNPASPLTRKPAAVMGAGGRVGTIRAQLHLRQIALHNSMFMVPGPEVLIMRAREQFDAQGQLTDERVLHDVDALIEGLVDLTRRLR